MKTEIQAAASSLFLTIAILANTAFYAEASDVNSIGYKNSIIEDLVCGDKDYAKSLNKIITLQEGDDYPYNYVTGEGKFYKIDRFLKRLIDIKEIDSRYSELVDRIFLGWNYCNLYEVEGQEVYFNISSDHSGKVPAKMGSGFKRLGFSSDDSDVIVPDLLKQISIDPRAYQQFFNRIYRQQCFPHPDTARTVKEGDAYNPLSSLYYSEHQVVYKRAKDAVFSCNSKIHNKAKPTVSKSKKPPVKKRGKRIKVQDQTAKKTKPLSSKASHGRKLKKSLKSETTGNNLSDQTTRVIQKITPENKIIKIDKLLQEDLDLGLDLPFVAPQSELVSGYVKIEDNKTKLSAKGNKEPNGTKKTTKFWRSRSGKRYLSGTAFLIKPLNTKKSPSLGTSLNFRLTNNINIYTSLKLYSEKEDMFAYSWGAKYRTLDKKWAFQVNNWGPLHAGDGLQFDKAVSSIGYRIGSKFLKKRKLASTVSLNKQHSAEHASLAASLQWYMNKNIYIRTRVSQPLGAGSPSWSLSFGYVDWRPNKFRYEYHNYGPDFYSNEGFVKDGLLQISYGWVW